MESRISAELIPQFESELERLLDEVGSVTAASARVTDARTDAADQGDNAVDVLVTLKTPQGSDPAATHWTVKQQDGVFSVVEDAANEPEYLAEEGAVSGWSRVWQEGDFGGARVDTTRYESPELARDAVVDVVSSPLGDLVETFEVGGVEGPIGLRYQAPAWLWVQPLARGPYVDQVSVLAGDTAMLVTASAVSTRDGRDLVSDLTRSAVDQASVG